MLLPWLLCTKAAKPKPKLDLTDPWGGPDLIPHKVSDFCEECKDITHFHKKIDNRIPLEFRCDENFFLPIRPPGQGPHYKIITTHYDGCGCKDKT